MSGLWGCGDLWNTFLSFKQQREDSPLFLGYMSSVITHQRSCHSFSVRSERAVLSADSQVWADDRKHPFPTLTSAFLSLLYFLFPILFILAVLLTHPQFPPSLLAIISDTKNTRRVSFFLSVTVIRPMSCHIYFFLIGVTKCQGTGKSLNTMEDDSGFCQCSLEKKQ